MTRRKRRRRMRKMIRMSNVQQSEEDGSLRRKTD
jgi:hypothetical protein